MIMDSVRSIGLAKKGIIKSSIYCCREDRGSMRLIVEMIHLCIWLSRTDIAILSTWYKSDGVTKFKFTAESVRYNAVDLYFAQLLRNRADINFTNEHGNTPLHYACFWGYQQVAEDLIAHGAIVSLANKDGDTPLDKARGSLAKRFHGKRIRFDPLV